MSESAGDSGSEPSQSTMNRALHNVDVVAAIILAIATVATAWCAYQSTRWSGVQATSFSQASAARIESSREFNQAYQILSIDADLFTDWVAAYADGDTPLLTFYETNLIRPAFLPFLEEWVESQPLENPDALPNPILNEQYRQELLAESSRLRLEAEAKFVQATDANQNGDDYVLLTVMFASVLFFAGISNKFERVKIQTALVILATAVLVIGFTQIASLPIH
jgi:hypothetical protein